MNMCLKKKTFILWDYCTCPLTCYLIYLIHLFKMHCTEEHHVLLAWETRLTQKHNVISVWITLVKKCLHCMIVYVLHRKGSCCSYLFANCTAEPMFRVRVKHQRIQVSLLLHQDVFSLSTAVDISHYFIR